MEKLFQIATTISTPLALGGLFAVIFFFIIKQMLAKDIFSPLTKSSSFNILKTIVDRLFVLALIAMLLGFAGYIIPILLSAISSQKSLPHDVTQESNKISVKYVNVAGHAIDFLMQGAINEKMEKDMADQPYIIPNKFFNKFKEMTDKFKFKIDIDMLRNKDEDIIENRIRGNKYSYLGLSYNNAVLSVEADMETINSVKNDFNKWNLSWNEDKSSWPGKDYSSIGKQGKIYAQDFLFWRLANPDDFKIFKSNKQISDDMDFYNLITKDYFPKGFSIIALNQDGCGQKWMIDLIIRSPILKVSIIENVTSHPIETGSFILKENDVEILREKRK